MEQMHTIRTLHINGFNLHSYCHRCDHWRVVDLTELVRDGHGGLRPPEHWMCPDCGELGMVRVRAPNGGQRAVSTSAQLGI
jgi:hypothetical protein